MAGCLLSILLDLTVQREIKRQAVTIQSDQGKSIGMWIAYMEETHIRGPLVQFWRVGAKFSREIISNDIQT